MAKANAKEARWITGWEMARRFGRNWVASKKIATAAGVRVQQYPGEPARYHEGDVERVAREATPAETPSLPREAG